MSWERRPGIQIISTFGKQTSYDDFSYRAAEVIQHQLKEKPDSCFGLPTGRTPLGTYKILAYRSRQGLLDWSKACCFALDDYLDTAEHMSFSHFLNEHLFQYTNLPETSRFNPKNYSNYDELISIKGGLDLTAIGIGRNGHIAFNEPGTPPASWTHCLWLTESTRKANSSIFGDLSLVPRRAISMGIATILASRKILLIASGEHKRDILFKALISGCDSKLPASYLRTHNNLEVLCDFDYPSG